MPEFTRRRHDSSIKEIILGPILEKEDIHSCRIISLAYTVNEGFALHEEQIPHWVCLSALAR